MMSVSERLAAIPMPVKAAAMIALIVGALWFSFKQTANMGKYEQPDLKMICTSCGHTEMMSVDEWGQRAKKELPGAQMAIRGGALKCPACGKPRLVRETGIKDTAPLPPEQQ